MSTIDRIVRLSLRSIWRNEARDFTVWLSENIDIIKDTIGIELINPETEQSTGNFYVDIKAEDATGNPVIIENQLEKSNHDHLGKLITYLVAFDAKIAIWIVKEPRQEHINTINWLNEGNNNCDFYLLKIEAIKIGNSAPAPLMSLIVGPSEEARVVGRIRANDNERNTLKNKFWAKLLEYSYNKHPRFKNISPTRHSYISASAGVSGFSYSYWLKDDGIRIELRIDKGSDNDAKNRELLQQLEAKKAAIETSFGDTLNFDDVAGARVCAIRKELRTGGLKSPEDQWSTIIEDAVSKMIKLDKALKAHLGQLQY